MAERKFETPDAKTIFPMPTKIVRTERADFKAKSFGTEEKEIAPSQFDKTAYDQVQDLWKDVGERFRNINSKIESNYLLVVAINVAAVASGVILLMFSVYFALISSGSEGTGIFSAITGGIGVADFVALFIVNPQTRIRRVLGDMVQMQMIYMTWLNQVYASYMKLISTDEPTDEDMTKFQEALKTYTADSVKSIEDNIGSDKE